MAEVYFAAMPFAETLFILCSAVLGAVWLSALKAREAAVAAARAACEAEGCQLLDDTVAGQRPHFMRNEAGVLCLSRPYTFEYSQTGEDRHRGRLVLEDGQVVLLHLGPSLRLVHSAPSAGGAPFRELPHEHRD